MNSIEAMQVAIRADSGVEIGMGHIMRCLTLAQALRDTQNAEVLFITRPHAGNSIALIEKQGFEVALLPAPEKVDSAKHDGDLAHAHWLGAAWQADAEQCRQQLHRRQRTLDWLVVDHYGLDQRWEQALAGEYRHCLVIDDLADRGHHCDLLLDQTFGGEEARYRPWVTPACELLLGTGYSLLRQEFVAAREKACSRRQHVSSPGRLLVFMGGGDPTNLTGQVIRALIDAGIDIPTDVVMSSQAPHVEQVRQLCDSHACLHLHIDTEAMAELMVNADLAIGAAGTTAWERAALGLPSLMVICADNQRLIAQQLNKAGAAHIVGEIDAVAQEDMSTAVLTLLNDPTSYRQMIDSCFRICDAQGSQRVVKAMTKMGRELPASPFIN